MSTNLAGTITSGSSGFPVEDVLNSIWTNGNSWVTTTLVDSEPTKTTCDQTNGGCGFPEITITPTVSSSYNAPPTGRDDSLDDQDLLTRVKRSGVILPRARPKAVERFGDCNVVAALPEGKPIQPPAYPGGHEFLVADQVNFKEASDPEASKAVPRWFTQTVDSQKSIPTITRISAAQYTDTAGSSEGRPSVDHAWENSWLHEFFTSMIDESAEALDKVEGAGEGKLTCADLKRYMFASDGTSRGTQNLLTGVWGSLASHKNMDFVGMSQYLNSEKVSFWTQPPRFSTGIDTSHTFRILHKIY